METIVCRNKILGRCQDCKPDLDPAHHPNNLDCPGFKPQKLMIIEVKEKEKESEKKE